jgi:von Willebrand factor type A domain
MFARVATVTALVFVLSFPLVSTGQQKSEPLDEKGVLTLLELGFDDETIVERIKEAGLTFEVTDAFVDKLKAAKAPEAVVKAAQAGSKSKSAPPTDAAPPVTFDQVLKMLSLRMKEDKVLERIAKTPPIFVLSAAQEEKLAKAGASPKVIAALKGDRPLPPAAAELITNVALVLDCSGSMKEMTKDGDTKMTAAKRVMTDLIEKIPANLNVTFVIYGHEAFSTADDPRNCQAVKVARPLGKLDAAGKAELTGLVASLKPTGGTPIALALKTTGDELAKKSDEFSGIVLITDGLESCKGNPTEEVATLLKTLKLSFGVNVVGLGVKEDEDAALKALADSGGGKYYDADDADALADSISAIAKELEVKAKLAEVVGASRRAVKILQPKVEMPEMAEIVLIETTYPVKEARLYQKGSITKYGEELRIPSSTVKYDLVWYPKEGEAILMVKGLQLTERKVIEIKPEDYVGFIKVNGKGTPKSIHAAVKDAPSVLSFSAQRTKKFGEVMVVPVGSYDVYIDESAIEEGLQVEAGKLYELE